MSPPLPRVPPPFTLLWSKRIRVENPVVGILYSTNDPVAPTVVS